MNTGRQQRDHACSVRHRIEHQQEARVAEIDTPDEFECDWRMARIALDCYGSIPLTDQFSLCHLGLNDVCRGSTARHSGCALPPVLSTRQR